MKKKKVSQSVYTMVGVPPPLLSPIYRLYRDVMESVLAFMTIKELSYFCLVSRMWCSVVTTMAPANKSLIGITFPSLVALRHLPRLRTLQLMNHTCSKDTTFFTDANMAEMRAFPHLEELNICRLMSDVLLSRLLPDGCAPVQWRHMRGQIVNISADISATVVRALPSITSINCNINYSSDVDA